MVRSLFVVSEVMVTPLPEAKVSMSVLPLAENIVFPTLIVLKIFCDDPGSWLVIVSPLMAIPVPAVRLRAPVWLCKERTPLLLMVVSLILIPDPLVRVTVPDWPWKLKTPVLVNLVPSIFIPAPLRVTAPVCPCIDSTPVLAMMGFWPVPETVMPFPAEMA